jgi:putative ABC transport system permease protein
MFRNYFTIAWRNLLRAKGYSALNIFGLATGMTVAMFIGLWVNYEYSFDRFLPHYEQLYQVRRNFNSNGEILNFTSTSLKLADALRSQIPEMQDVAESGGIGSHGLLVGDKKFYIEGAEINGDFLKMFEYPLLEGNPNAALVDPYSIVLTQATAKALFGDQNAMGRTVRFDNKNDLKVTGIFANIPSNSTLQFNYIVPFSYLEATQNWVKRARKGGYGWNSFAIYVQLKAGVRYAQVASKIKDIERTETENTNAMKSEVVLQPVKNWHLYDEYENGIEVGGFLKYVQMFTIIGALVLLIACINFINLTTARSEKRAKEVGVRIAIGSRRKDLVLQFLAESFFLTGIAFLFCLLLVELLLGPFNTLTHTHISIPFSSGLFWLVVLFAVCMTGLIAGSRPAFYLSSFQAVQVLKGTKRVGKSAALPRKILVVLQFGCSVALIISTIIIYQQIQHAKERPVGYSMDRLMVTQMNDDLSHNFEALRHDLLEKGIVESISTATGTPTEIGWHSDVDKWPGKYAGETIEMGSLIVSPDYFKTLGITLDKGRDFSNLADTACAIFNETAIKQMRIKEPLNAIVTFQDQQFRIIGVARDALMVSPFAPADPTIFLYDPSPRHMIIYRLSSKLKTPEAISQLSAVFNQYNPAFPFSYSFTDQSYAVKFDLEILVGRLAFIFAGLAIFISCLGLFGLAAYMAEQRTKEIGIRKVLGASAPQIWLLLSWDFLLLVLVSCLVASPVAFYFLQNWLQKYTYRITITGMVFLLAALVAIAITLITISFQAIRAAMANPASSLRSE